MAAPDADALIALPVVGALVGALAGMIGDGASRVLGRELGAALALAALVILTGAIHLDGFLDGCDAFFASVAPERRLAILKDPHHGTYAVAGMFVAGCCWYAALVTLAPEREIAALAFAGALARAAVLPCAFAFPYARIGAAPRAFVTRPPIGAVVATLVVLAVAAYAFAPPYVLLVPALVALAFVLARTIARRLDGGLVGDAYGFLIVIGEVVATVALAWAGAHLE